MLQLEQVIDLYLLIPILVNLHYLFRLSIVYFFLLICVLLQLIEKLKSEQIRQEQWHLRAHLPLPNSQVFQLKYMEYFKVERHLIHL